MLGFNMLPLSVKTSCARRSSTRPYSDETIQTGLR